MKLRPHHLLCTQGYAGNGYNDAFVQNMTAITNHLRTEANATIEIVFSTDDICTQCPSMLGNNLCKDNAKVKLLDKKVIDYFCIEETQYVYKDIISKINSQMTCSMMEDICSDCSWFPMSACKKNILQEPHCN